MPLVIERLAGRLPEERAVEVVERKGLGHPDSICDALAEALSLALSRLYLERTGAILHHNVDKALLVGGAAEPRFGGGRVLAPMRILLAGRATLALGERVVPIAELAEQTVRQWLAEHLHALDARRHVEIEALVRPGSGELVALFGAGPQRALANDTSCGVGFAPLSKVEQVVLAVENALNAPAVRERHPALGEDVKVMAIRRGERLQLTVACALIDAAIPDLAGYARARQCVAEIVEETAAGVTTLPVDVAVNAADDLDAGRLYLTVTGTSAEAGDDGQAGRGNRANGLITPGRPMTMESVAGKNPVTHVGKLYNVAAALTAERLVAALPEVSAAECRMVSCIGRPIDQPDVVEVSLAGPVDPHDPDLVRRVDALVAEMLAGLPQLGEALVRGDLALDRWPLHHGTAIHQP